MITIVKIFGVNVSAVPYVLVFMSDGSAYAYNVASLTTDLIANPGTFSATGPGDVTVWQGNIVLIVDPATGYWRWPGAGTTGGGGGTGPDVRLIAAPSISKGNAGNVEAGAHKYAITFTINGVETNLGESSDSLDLDVNSIVRIRSIPTGPSGTTARNIYRTAADQESPFKLLHTISDNTTTSYNDNIADASLGATAPARGQVDTGSHQWAVVFVSGSGDSNLTDPSGTLSVPSPETVLVFGIPLGPGGTTARKLYRNTIADPGTFYLVTTIGDNTTTEYSDITADQNLGVAAASGAATVMATVIDATKTGTTLAVFAGRVWIANNRTTQFTSPKTFNDFDIANSAGSFIMTDSNFIGPIYKLLTALNVLWVFGESAMNQVSNVTVLSGTTTTIFSNINVSSSVGTTFPQSVISFLRQVEFATKYGIIQQIGVTPQRISEKIDGTYKLLDLTEPVTAGLVVLNNILCYGLMVTYLDPDHDGAARKIILLVTFDGKWFIGSQGDTLRLMTSVEHAGTYRLFGCDTNNLSELFVEPGYPVHNLKTPFFDNGDVTAGKDMMRLMMVMNFQTTTPIIMTCVPQTALEAKAISNPDRTNAVLFTPAQGQFIDWENGNQALPFVSQGYNMPQWFFEGVNSKLIGFDMALNSDPFEILGYALDVIDRESWGDTR